VPSASRSIMIHRPSTEVFPFFADAENDSQWRSGVKEIKRHGELGLGTRYHQLVKGPAGRAIGADIEVTAYEPDSAATKATKKVDIAIDKGDYDAVVKAVNDGDEKIIDAAES